MKRLFLLLALLLAAAPAAAQAPDRSPRVIARLVAEGPVAPGGEVWIALEEVIRPGWHTYWINPGDAGNPTTIDWTLPEGWSAGEIQWPRPKRLPVGPLMDYGYEGKLWLLSRVTAPADARPGETVRLDAAATWLVCERICIPEEAALSIDVTIGDGPRDAAVAQAFAEARALLPTDSPWRVSYALGHTIDLYLAAPALAAARPQSVEFYPLDAGVIRNPAPQLVGYAEGGLVLRLTPGAGAATATALNGVLVLTGSDGSVQALNIRATQGLVPAADFSAALQQSAADVSVMPLWLAMAFAALGGLILNIMPCVLPILAMKALAMARHAGSERRIVVTETLAYAGGVILSFLALGLALLALRAGGEAVGWGFQLQSPVAVAGFALLIFAVGLNLSGVFEVGSITAGDSLTHKNGAAGAFFTGMLAVAVGAPCTMPFGAAALGFALTQSAVSALLVFLALGLGFALPFLILGLVPGALAFLPKPGPWMLRFKQFLAFPMYAAAAWLAWVLSVQAGAGSLAALFAAAVTLALAAWLWSSTRGLAARGRAIGAGVVLLLLLGAGFAIARLQPANAAQPDGTLGAALPNSEPYSAARLAELRAAGRPVFIDATAAWCITCLVNEETALSREAVKTAFSSREIAYLVADWTNRNPEGTALLTAHGRAGPPLYLYYAPGATAPKVLPQILTESIVLDAIR